MRANFIHNNVTMNNNIKHKIISNIMFRSLMKHFIICKKDVPLTIMKESIQPNSFFTSLDNSHILNFSNIQSNYSMQSDFPTHNTTTNSKDIPYKISSFIYVFNKIKINVPNESIYSSPKLQITSQLIITF